MKFYLSDTGEVKEITVRSWNGSGYGPDCFNDLEINFPEDHEMREEDYAYICTSGEYKDLLEWWQDEVAAMQAGTCAHDIDYGEGEPDENIKIFAD